MFRRQCFCPPSEMAQNHYSDSVVNTSGFMIMSYVLIPIELHNHFGPLLSMADSIDLAYNFAPSLLGWPMALTTS